MSITATYYFQLFNLYQQLEDQITEYRSTRKHFSVDRVFDWELTQEEDELADSLPSSAAFLEQGAIGGHITRIRMHPTRASRVVAKDGEQEKMVSRNRCIEAECHLVGG